mmetsp:Transcript_20401/g.62009  ORF Transcript_20401/g.62009 Transcript_20401/m.62009 type:complete len:510 (+) Transcript_20401:195-1724(+)
MHCPHEGHPKRRAFTLVDIGIAWMLLGSVAFVMVLFYLVNYKDDDIRRYSWCIISTTISIFTAVLIFQGINEIIMVAIKPQTEMLVVVINFALFLVWFIMLQLTIAVVSGANCEGGTVHLNREAWVVADSLRADYGEEVHTEVRNPVGQKSIAVLGGLEVFVQKSKVLREFRESQMKCYATLLAHMTGFAAINFGGAVQHLDVFKASPAMTVVAMLMSQAMLFALFRAATEVRKHTSALDGQVDERDELYMEHVEEAENETAGLSVSFLTVQAMRYWLTGQLPTISGHEHPEYEHPVGAVLGLVMMGCAVGACSLMLFFVLDGPTLSKSPGLRRLLQMVETQGLMVFAWCLLWAARWQAFRSHVFGQIGGPDSMGGRIILALVLSLCSLAAIGGLDTLADAARARGTRDDAQVTALIFSGIEALSLTVGFSWEHSFDGGVAAVASLTRTPHLTKFALAIVVALVIVPAWRKFILEKVMIHKRKHEEDVETEAVRNGWRPSAYEQLGYEE